MFECEEQKVLNSTRISRIVELALLWAMFSGAQLFLQMTTDLNMMVFFMFFSPYFVDFGDWVLLFCSFYVFMCI
jgi:hypothetical protein